MFFRLSILFLIGSVQLAVAQSDAEYHDFSAAEIDQAMALLFAANAQNFGKNASFSEKESFWETTYERSSKTHRNHHRILHGETTCESPSNGGMRCKVTYQWRNSGCCSDVYGNEFSTKTGTFLFQDEPETGLRAVEVCYEGRDCFPAAKPSEDLEKSVLAALEPVEIKSRDPLPQVDHVYYNAFEILEGDGKIGHERGLRVITPNVGFGYARQGLSPGQVIVKANGDGDDLGVTSDPVDILRILATLPEGKTAWVLMEDGSSLDLRRTPRREHENRITETKPRLRLDVTAPPEPYMARALDLIEIESIERAARSPIVDLTQTESFVRTHPDFIQGKGHRDNIAAKEVVESTFRYMNLEEDSRYMLACSDFVLGELDRLIEAELEPGGSEDKAATLNLNKDLESWNRSNAWWDEEIALRNPLENSSEHWFFFLVYYLASNKLRLKDSQHYAAFAESKEDIFHHYRMGLGSVVQQLWSTPCLSPDLDTHLRAYIESRNEFSRFLELHLIPLLL